MPIVAALLRFAERLRFKQLFFITAGLFALNVVIPDVIPFVDELLLGLLTLLFAAWRKKPEQAIEPAAGGGSDARTYDGEVVDVDTAETGGRETRSGHLPRDRSG